MSIYRQNYVDVNNYLDNQRELAQITKGTFDIYKRVLHLLLQWADDRSLSEAPSISPTFPVYLDKIAEEEDKFTQHFLDESCRIVRAFFTYCTKKDHKRFRKVNDIWIEQIRAIQLTASSSKIQYYTLEEMIKLCKVQPTSLTQKRIRAAAAFLYLSGLRIRAFLTLPINCLNIDTLRVYQYPDHGVYTKMNKSAVTSLFNIKELLDVVCDWDQYVRENCPPDTTWYAKFYSNVRLAPKKPPIGRRNDTYYQAISGEKQFRLDLHKLCDSAGIEYKKPHAFRNGHTHYGISHCSTLAQMKAVSQNLMHGSVAITDSIYSRLTEDDINLIISTLGLSTPVATNSLPKESSYYQKKEIDSLSDKEKKDLLRVLLDL